MVDDLSRGAVIAAREINVERLVMTGTSTNLNVRGSTSNSKRESRGARNARGEDG